MPRIRRLQQNRRRGRMRVFARKIFEVGRAQKLRVGEALRRGAGIRDGGRGRSRFPRRRRPVRPSAVRGSARHRKGNRYKRQGRPVCARARLRGRRDNAIPAGGRRAVARKNRQARGLARRPARKLDPARGQICVEISAGESRRRAEKEPRADFGALEKNKDVDGFFGSSEIGGFARRHIKNLRSARQVAGQRRKARTDSLYKRQKREALFRFYRRKFAARHGLFVFGDAQGAARGGIRRPPPVVRRPRRKKRLQGVSARRRGNRGRRNRTLRKVRSVKVAGGVLPVGSGVRRRPALRLHILCGKRNRQGALSGACGGGGSDTLRIVRSRGNGGIRALRKFSGGRQTCRRAKLRPSPPSRFPDGRTPCAR